MKCPHVTSSVRGPSAGDPGSTALGVWPTCRDWPCCIAGYLGRVSPPWMLHAQLLLLLPCSITGRCRALANASTDKAHLTAASSGGLADSVCNDAIIGRVFEPCCLLSASVCVLLIAAHRLLPVPPGSCCCHLPVTSSTWMPHQRCSAPSVGQQTAALMMLLVSQQHWQAASEAQHCRGRQPPGICSAAVHQQRVSFTA